MAKITVKQNGPYVVHGDDVEIIDWNGNAYQVPNSRCVAAAVQSISRFAMGRIRK